MLSPTASSLQRQAWQSIAEIPFKAAILPDRLWRMATAEFEEAPYDVVYTENKTGLRRYEPEEVRHEAPIAYAFALFDHPRLTRRGGRNL